MEGEVLLGDCLDVLRSYPGRLFDAVVTDPPAGIGMDRGNKNKARWDHDRGGRDRWVRWLSERLGAARDRCRPGARLLCWSFPRRAHWTGLAIEDAGWVIEDLVTHLNGQARPRPGTLGPGWEGWWLARDPRGPSRALNLKDLPVVVEASSKLARKPRNVLIDQGCQLDLLLRDQGGERKTSDHAGLRNSDKTRHTYGKFKGQKEAGYEGDSGSVVRYFQLLPPLAVYAPRARFRERELAPGVQSRHSTAKSPALMRWMVSLISSPGDLVLDCFCGSGSTGQACLSLGRSFLGIEMSDAFCEEARLRLRPT